MVTDIVVLKCLLKCAFFLLVNVYFMKQLIKINIVLKTHLLLKKILNKEFHVYKIVDKEFHLLLKTYSCKQKVLNMVSDNMVLR